MVFNDEWLKSNCSMTKIKSEIAKQRNDFQNHCLLIETTCKAIGLKPEKYYAMLTDRKDITYIVDLINNDKEVKQEYAETSIEMVYQTETPITLEDVADSDLYEYTLTLYGTRAQLKLLKEYLEHNNIKYEKVK